jgi:membrane-bound ClpP family serine protease|uniref:NfeD family protein n=1 Tax=Cephaloticoccus sp. TaxID=1985742 RepID=UPI00404AD6E7
MNAIVLLFAVGLLLLGFEVVVPGGVLGVIGALAMLGGCGVAFANFGMSGGLMAVSTAFVLGALMLYFEFVLLPKTALGKRFFLTTSIKGTTAAIRADNLTGKVGTAVTALAPSGYVAIDGQQHEAFSRSGFLDAGVAVKVVGADNFRLIVTPEKVERI